MKFYKSFLQFQNLRNRRIQAENIVNQQDIDRIENEILENMYDMYKRQTETSRKRKYSTITSDVTRLPASNVPSLSSLPSVQPTTTTTTTTTTATNTSQAPQNIVAKPPILIQYNYGQNPGSIQGIAHQFIPSVSMNARQAEVNVISEYFS
jgi:ribosome-binding ATPase YchF (GTP1/OBG family)